MFLCEKHVKVASRLCAAMPRFVLEKRWSRPGLHSLLMMELLLRPYTVLLRVKVAWSAPVSVPAWQPLRRNPEKKNQRWRWNLTHSHVTQSSCCMCTKIHLVIPASLLASQLFFPLTPIAKELQLENLEGQNNSNCRQSLISFFF